MLSVKHKLIQFIQPYASGKMWKVVNWFDRKRLKNTNFTYFVQIVWEGCYIQG